MASVDAGRLGSGMGVRRIVLLAVVVLAFVPGVAVAAPRNPSPTNPTYTAPTPTTTPAAPTSTPVDQSGGEAGSPDDLQQLNGDTPSPACTSAASSEVLRDCRDSGMPESIDPPGNYGLDQNVSTGISNLGGYFPSGIQDVFNWLAQAMASLLALVFDGLTLAFNFDLFRNGGQYIPSALSNAENQFTFPLLLPLLGIGGMVAAWHLFRDNPNRSVAHLVMMVGLIVVGLVIIAEPATTLGWFDQQANGAAQGALSAFSGAGGGTTGSYADATPALWRTMEEEPWCAMEFGNVSTWCMAPVTPVMAAARDATLRNLGQAQGNQSAACSFASQVGSPLSAVCGVLEREQEPIERARLLDARTNGELFLAFPPDWNARNGGSDSWTLYYALASNYPQLAAIRGSGGVGERFVDGAIAGIGEAAMLLLLIWIAGYLLVAAIFFLVLLMCAPVMVLAPVFGERGQRAFMAWLGYLVAALCAKLVYALYLGIMIGVSTLLVEIGPSVDGQNAWLMQWILFTALWLIAFHFRRKLPEMLIGQGHRQWGGDHAMRGVGIGVAAGVVLGDRLIRRPNVTRRRQPAGTP